MAQQIIIVDGIDGVGKSTIIKALSEKIGIPSYKRSGVKFSYDFAIDLSYTVEGHCQFLEQTGYSVIFDRLYPSEYAYGYTYKRDVLVSKLFEIDRRFAEMGAKIIICEKSKTFYQEDDLIEIDRYSEIITWFRRFQTVTACKNIVLNTDDEDLEKQIKTITEFL